MTDQDKAERFEEGVENSHKANDASQSTHSGIEPQFLLANSLIEDERSIANRLANETKKDKDDDEGKTEEDKLRDQDATLPVSLDYLKFKLYSRLIWLSQAKSHGNKPSRGAEIDQELREEEAEILKKKGSFGPNV